MSETEQQEANTLGGVPVLPAVPVYVLYNASETIVLGIFDSLETLQESAEALADSEDLELNIDLFGYVVPMNHIYPIGLDEEGLIEL